jgi:hypothetical protein
MSARDGNLDEKYRGKTHLQVMQPVRTFLLPLRLFGRGLTLPVVEGSESDIVMEAICLRLLWFVLEWQLTRQTVFKRERERACLSYKQDPGASVPALAIIGLALGESQSMIT